jgi:hypothetical protein
MSRQTVRTYFANPSKRGVSLEIFNWTRQLAPPLAIAENRDEFALTEQGWKIRRRRSRVLFARQ